MKLYKRSLYRTHNKPFYYFKKLSALSLALLLFLSPLEVLAETQISKRNGVTTIDDDIPDVNITAKSAKVDYQKQEIEPNIYQVNVDVDLVQRTLVNLDVVKIRDMNNILNQDYKSNMKDRVEDLVPEIKHADVIEYEGFTNSFRDSVTVDSESTTDYASKLDYLINNNMINRTTYFLYNEMGTSASQNRTPRPKVDDNEEIKDEDSTSFIPHKYYYPKHKISKTDFLTELMKVDSIEESRPIFVTTNYKRIMENLQEYVITSEPIETSPYASVLGKTGLDYGVNDIVVWHDYFGQQEILVTNDVTEYYLQNALNKNIVSKDEVGGIEGAAMLEDMNNAVKDGYMNTHKAIRQYYNQNPNTMLKRKIMEEDIVYPKEMVDNPGIYQEIQKDILDISSNSDQGTLPPWGRTYYSNAENCVFANPFNKKPVELLKRPSIVEVGNKYWSYKPPAKVKDEVGNESGYAFFKKEEITVAEAYILAYKLLLALGTESKLTPTEINYLNSKYSLNFTSFTAEERQATEYLIAKGIVDGNGEYLYTASSTPLTNETAIDIIYRIANTDARIDFTPQLSATDINMATQGFAQTTITKTDSDIGDVKVYEDVTKGKKLYTKEGDGEEVEFKNDSTPTSYNDLQNKDRVQNPSVYDLIYIRLPKTGEDNKTYFKLVTDNDTRVLVDPVNKGKLDYGNGSNTEVGKKITEEWKKAKTSLNKSPKNGEIEEELNESGDNNDYVFKDKDGYLWRRYLIHKSMSSKVMLVGFSNNASYTFRGIKGEGIYIVEDNVTTGDLRKVSLSDGENLTTTERISKTLVKFDENVRNLIKFSDMAELPIDKIHPLAESDDLILWSQNNYMAEDVNANVSSIMFAKDLMDLYLYDGQQFFEKNDKGEYVISGNLNLPESVKKNFVKLLHDQTTDNYYLQYKSPYQDYLNNTLIDITNHISCIGAKVGDEDDIKMPGYARIAQNGNEVAVITDTELQNAYGIEKKSEKMLYNAKTGQRAFFNTIDSTTLIGNNVTRYPENHLIVTAHGEGDDKVLYYNLHAALELINDTNVVAKTVGDKIYTAIGDTDSALKKSYRLIDVKDVNKGTANTGYTTVDRTYIESSSTLTSPNYFMNLSALCGPASNFIYYKDKVLDLDLLIVYNPYIDNTELKQYAGPAKVAVDNSLLKSTSNNLNHDTVISSSVNLGDALENDVKAQIFHAIFGTSEMDAVQGILNGPYNIDIHIVASKGANDDMLRSKFGDLVTLLTNNDPSRIKTLKDSIYKIDDVFKTDAFEDFDGKDKLVNGTNLSIGVIKAGTILTDSSQFVKCNDSGNLYYRIYGKSGNTSKPNVAELKDKLGTRFYYDDKGTKDSTDDDEILMRKNVNYSDTGADYLPLEMFSMPEYRSGLALSNTSGKYSYNISDSKEVKLTSPDRNLAANSANVYITKKRVGSEGASDIGLATMIELPYRELTPEQIKKLFAKNVFTKDNTDTHAGFLNTFFEMVIKVFDDSMGDYKVSEAVGAGNFVSTSVGWDYEGCDNEKEQFFQGMWHISENNSYYMPERIPPTANAQGQQTEAPITYVMIVGNVVASDSVYPTHDAIIYLGKVINVGNNKTLVTDIKPFSSFDQLPERIRYYIETEDAKYLTESQASLNSGNSTKKVSSSPIKLLYKPSIAIPAGTTLLKASKNGGSIDTFILAPHKVETEYSSSIRSVMFTAKDIVNTCLALEQEDPTFLYQVPKGSHIKIGDADFVKYSSPDTDSEHLTWVRCMTTPTYSSDNQSVVTIDRDLVSEMSLLTQYITQVYGIGIPIGGGAANIGNIQLGDVMGPGAYRIPTLEELKFLNEWMGKKTWMQELYSKVSRVFGFSVSSNLTNTMSNTYMTYNPLIYNLSDSKLMVSTDENVTDASILLTLNLPPSLQVIENPDLEDTFDVVGYWDINQFNVDPSGEMVSYLKSKDTEVVSLDTIIRDVKATDVSGLPYLNAAEEEKVQFTMKGIINFIVYAIPAIAFIIWIIRTTFVVIFSFNKSREWADNVNSAVGWNVMTPFTLGIYRPNQSNIDIPRYIIMSIVFSGVLALFYGKFIIIWVASIFSIKII